MPWRETVKLLLVDDLAENLLALEALLGGDGVEIFKARSGPEALELLLVHDFALALLDVQMAGMDGFELAETMRGTLRTRRVPIIFLTAVATDERRRFRGYEAGAIDYLLKPIDPQILKNKVEVFLELHRQRQALARQRDELRQGADRLSEALARLQAHRDNAPLAIVEFDAGFRPVSWSKGAERLFGWSAAEVVGQSLTALGWIHEEDWPRFEALRTDMLAGERTRAVHLIRNRCRNGAVLECEWYSSALLDAGGRPVSISAQILDVTERRRAEETQRLLIGELNHRVKNMLATVQAIATQTLRHSGDPARFATAFSGRIQALARAHSLLSGTTWHGARLADLVQDQLRLGTADESRLTAAGPEVHLPPQLALHLALILHELGTNASKYGAFANTQGRVALAWRVEDGRLRLDWTESGGPPVAAPSRRGFGTTLIEQIVRSEGGEAHATFHAEGLSWSLSVALPRAAAEPVRPVAVTTRARPAAVVTKPSPERPAKPLEGRRLLVVEDEMLVALEVAATLEDGGAAVVGPAATPEQALRLVEEEPALDGALLDGNLNGRPVDDIAAALTRRGVPFLFVSGYGRGDLPAAFGHAVVVAKPFTPAQLLDAAVNLVRQPAEVVPLRPSAPPAGPR